MAVAIDVSGEKYGRLVALKRVANDGRHTVWLFRCDCGSEIELRLDQARRGIAQSCGCLRVETTRKRSLKHGHQVDREESRTLKAYRHAKSRCFNSSDPKFAHYGGRGITMCAEWKTSFDAFLRDMGECPPDRTLDRVDVNGHYEPRNCRWATTFQQARSRTDNILVKDGGQTLVLKDFAVRVGVPYKALWSMMKRRGIDAHQAAKLIIGR